MKLNKLQKNKHKEKYSQAYHISIKTMYQANNDISEKLKLVVFFQNQSFIIQKLIYNHCREPVRHSARDKGHEEGGSAYAKAGSSLRSPPEYSRAFSPKKKTRVCLLYCVVLSPLTLLGAVPHHHLTFCQRVNLQLQLIKFLGNQECLNPNPSDGSLTRLTSLPGLLQLCIRLFTVSQPPEAREA